MFRGRRLPDKCDGAPLKKKHALTKCGKDSAVSKRVLVLGLFPNRRPAFTRYNLVDM